MSPKAPKKEKEEVEEEPEVTCPVCGNPVTLDDPFCPHCGAEFEEEEVEEISISEEIPEAPEEYQEAEVQAEPEEEKVEEEFEVEEEPEAEAEAEVEVVEEVEEVEAEEVEAEEEEVAEEVEEVVEEEEPEEEEVVEEVVEVEEVSVSEAPKAKPAAATASLKDMRVFGIALLIVGIIGLQIALFINWYWTWVPPISANLGLYALIGFVIVIVGFVAFLLVKKSTEEKGKKYHPMLPTILLSIFVFGIFAVVFLLAGGAISDAMQDNQGIVAVLFLVFIVVGVLLFMMGQKRTAGAPA